MFLLPVAQVGAAGRAVEVAPHEWLHVMDVGAGATVVLLPGAMGTSFALRRLAPLLADSGYRVLTVEPLGLGDSSRPEDADYSLTAQADRVAALLDLLGSPQVVVVGHGLGASIALRMACRHADRVAAVVSLDGGPAESAASPSLRRALKFAPLLQLFGGARRLRSGVRESLVSNSADPAWVTPEAVEGYLGPVAHDLDAALASYRRIARAPEPESLRDRLAEVRCPVLLLVGQVPHPAGIRPEEAGLLAARLKHFERWDVPEAGHFIAEEAPVAVVAAVAHTLTIARFHASTGARGGERDAALR
jgi:pimeloyl-ACP methyl ester carboxylesterase